MWLPVLLIGYFKGVFAVLFGAALNLLTGSETAFSKSETIGSAALRIVL